MSDATVLPGRSKSTPGNATEPQNQAGVKNIKYVAEYTQPAPTSGSIAAHNAARMIGLFV